MSANNQVLVKEYKGKWYVFGNLMAESWVHYDEKTEKFDDSRVNELKLSDAEGVFNSRDEAYEFALKVDRDDFPTEYGVQFNRLCKDDSEVKIIE
jgi:hypothetical protein